MARQIIILEQPGLPSDLRYNVAFWLAVPATRQAYYADPAFKSAVVGITGPELTALQSGQVLERIEEVSYTKGTGMAAITADLERRYTELQGFLTAQNPFNRYGSFWDGTTWTQVTVA
jgi:hypothetical protein